MPMTETKGSVGSRACWPDVKEQRARNHLPAVWSTVRNLSMMSHIQTGSEIFNLDLPQGNKSEATQEWTVDESELYRANHMWITGFKK